MAKIGMIHERVLEGQNELLESAPTVTSSNVNPWTSRVLKELMFPEESNMIEKYVSGLPDMIHGSVMASKPKTMQDALEFATELMDKKEHQAENKRKLNNNNQAQQQLPKRSDCPGLENRNHGNQTEGTEARGMVYALGGGETNQDLDDMEYDINA
ncbi:hypothetical protein Tco_1032232 [Tanacetum coccineum]|uniref:Reverse transcriptase domain-containing protein n=1 Tax=Tanacetum coccineum TaxID=301880 RepID=A0ABQ5GBD3_9ASTR